MKKKLAVAPEPEPEIKLDLGCGPRKMPNFTGVDIRAIDGVDVVHDLRKPWPWKDGSVSEVHCSHFLEHLTGPERVHFFNELYRVLKSGAQARIITPDWSNDCAYGDPTHQWPPMSRWYVFYLHKGWRDANAPHVGYKCDFDWVCAGAPESWLEVRNREFAEFATMRYTNSLRELIVTLTKRAP